MQTTMRRAAMATAGLVVAGGVVFGATESFAASPSGTSAVSAAAVAASTTASGSGNGANTCKNAKHPARCARRREAGRDRAALFTRGAHGQRTVKDSSGAYVVREWQVGKVTAVGGTSVTVVSGDGTTWTWTTQSSTTFRVDGAKGTLSGVHVGDTILASGRLSGGANDAKAIFDPNQSKPAAKLR